MSFTLQSTHFCFDIESSWKRISFSPIHLFLRCVGIALRRQQWREQNRSTRKKENKTFKWWHVPFLSLSTSLEVLQDDLLPSSTRFSQSLAWDHHTSQVLKQTSLLCLPFAVLLWTSPAEISLATSSCPADSVVQQWPLGNLLSYTCLWNQLAPGCLHEYRRLGPPVTVFSRPIQIH